MKKIFLLAALLGLLFPLRAHAQTAADSTLWAAIDWQWTDLGKGARAGYAQIHIWDSVQSISFVTYPIRKFRTSLVHAPGELSNTTDSLARREHARFALNGSYFNMKRLTPVTFFNLAHRVVGVTPASGLYRSNGVLCIRNRCGKRLEIIPYDSTRTENYRRQYYSALASGPILMLDGKVPPFPAEGSFYQMRHPRTIFGWDAAGTAYMVVVDGRFPGQAAGMSILELTVIARLLGMKDAINLDGGGSSTLWTDRTGVINYPYDNRVFDHAGMRKVPNILIVK